MANLPPYLLLSLFSIILCFANEETEPFKEEPMWTNATFYNSDLGKNVSYKVYIAS